MATSFDIPFEQFLLIIDDPRFINNYTRDCLAMELSKYLYRSIGVCGDYLYKNVNNYTYSQRQFKYFTGNGVTTQFTLSDDFYDNSEFYISVNDSEISNFTHDANTITITPAPSQNASIYIANYKLGEFVDNLNHQEVTFLSRGMTIPYLEFQLQKQKHLNQIVYGKDTQVHSQANHIKEGRETIDDVEKRLKQDMIMYTYQQDTNKLKGSVGM